MADVTVRLATEEDVPQLLPLIRSLVASCGEPLPDEDAMADIVSIHLGIKQIAISLALYCQENCRLRLIGYAVEHDEKRFWGRKDRRDWFPAGRRLCFRCYAGGDTDGPYRRACAFYQPDDVRFIF